MQAINQIIVIYRYVLVVLDVDHEELTQAHVVLNIF